MVKELVERLNNEAIKQTTSFDEQEELDCYFKGWIIVSSGLFLDKLSRYEKSMFVLKHPDLDEYIGINCITNLYSDQSEYRDFGLTYKFYEMQPTQHITYTIIN